MTIKVDCNNSVETFYFKGMMSEIVTTALGKNGEDSNKVITQMKNEGPELHAVGSAIEVLDKVADIALGWLFRGKREASRVKRSPEPVKRFNINFIFNKE